MIKHDWSAGFRQPSKRRFLAALAHVEIGEISYYEGNVAPEIASIVLGKPLGPNDLNLVLPPDDAVELARRLGMDMVTRNEGWVFGRQMQYDSDGRRVFLHGLVHTRADLRSLRPPSLDAIKRRFDEMVPVLQDSGMGINYGLDTTQALVIRAMGYDHYFTRIYDDPAFLHEFNLRVDEWVLASTQFVVEQCPVDTVTLALNLCDKNGPMYSPPHIDEFCFGPLREQLAVIRGRGVPCILHTDGDNTRLMKSYVDMGIDALHPVEPCPGFDIYEIKSQYGEHICLLGNINLAGPLAFGTPEQVVAETQEHIRRLAPGGGYACGSSHDVNHKVPSDNLHAMIRTVCETRWTPPMSQRTQLPASSTPWRDRQQEGP